MSESPTHSGTGEDEQAREQRTSSSGSSGFRSKMAGSVRRGASSGALAAIAGTINLLRARRAFQKGSRARAIRRGAMAAFWTAVAVTQWQSKRSGIGQRSRSGHVDQTDVISTAPDVEAVSSGSESGETDPDAVADAGATSIDVTEADSSPEVDDAADTEAVDDARGIEDVDDAEGVEDVDDAEGLANVDDAEGIDGTEAESSDESDRPE